MALPIDINDLLNKRKVESNRIEFKRGWNPDKIYHSICAFANDFDNLGGGYILVGVDEENGKAKRPVEGVPENKLDDIQKGMIGFNNKIEPYYQPRTEIETIDGKYVFVIWVPSGVNRPYNVLESVNAKHSTPKWYIRCGSNSIEAKGEVLDELREMANRTPFDDRGNPDISLDDLSPLLVQDYLRSVNSKLAKELNVNNLSYILEQMDLYTGPTERRMLKNVSAMMFCDHLDKFFPYTQIDVVVFPEGKTKNPNIFSETTFKGSVPQLIHKTLDYLQAILIREYVIKQKSKAESIRFFNYPYQALEEAIVNSMYHRDYQEHEPVEITIEPERISILSFSGPDRSISTDAIKECNTLRSRRYRNRRLGDYLKELDLTEGRGTGIPTIQDELTKNGSPRAVIETDESRSYFLIDIPIHTGCGDVVVLNSVEVDGGKRLSNDQVNGKKRQSSDRVATEYDQVNGKKRQSNDRVATEYKEELQRDVINTKILTLCNTPQTRRDILENIGLRYHSDNYNKYIKPLIENGCIEQTEKSKTSPQQKYIITERGKYVLSSERLDK